MILSNQKLHSKLNCSFFASQFSFRILYKFNRLVHRNLCKKFSKTQSDENMLMEVFESFSLILTSSRHSSSLIELTCHYLASKVCLDYKNYLWLLLPVKFIITKSFSRASNQFFYPIWSFSTNSSVFGVNSKFSTTPMMCKA